MHVIVIVLGDIGRSPRMQYHCVSLLECGHSVTLIGYTGESLLLSLQQQQQEQTQTQTQTQDKQTSPVINQKRLHVIRFHSPTLFQQIPLLYFVWRCISLSYYVLYTLLISVQIYPVDFVLIQNPPAIPLMILSVFYCHVIRYLRFKQQGRRRPGLIIDWHNLGSSMFRNGSLLQRMTKLYETIIAQYADGHFTVTKAMKEHLIQEMKIGSSQKKKALPPNIQVLYDCPPIIFQPLSVQDQHVILLQLHDEMMRHCPRYWLDDEQQQLHDAMMTTTTTTGSINNKTLFTESYCSPGTTDAATTTTNNIIRHRPGRPALVITSTSWTADEDFGLLLKALIQLDTMIRQQQQQEQQTLLRVVVVVTGKGPQRQMYEDQIQQLQLQQVVIITMWLQIQDYPKLIACADIGISLHTSTSGLDLPMKVLDLFGCQIPVLAHDFSCLHELVQDNINGRIFSTSNELANLLYTLLLPLQQQQQQQQQSSGSTVTPSSSSIPNHSFGVLQMYSDQLQDRTRWHTNWIDHALPGIMLATPMR